MDIVEVNGQPCCTVGGIGLVADVTIGVGQLARPGGLMRPIVRGLGPHAYTACKHAVIGLTKSVAAELAGDGIRVNAIAPGNTVTGMTSIAYTGEATNLEATAERIKAGSNLGIAGEPVDIANAALYLASDEARYVTGHCLVVDAGQTTNAGSARFASATPALIVEGGRRA